MKPDSARPGAPSRSAAIRKNALKALRPGENGSGELDKRRLLAALTRLKKGYFDVRLPGDQIGLDGEIADTFNDVVELHQAMSRELERLSHAVGNQGRLSERASLRAFSIPVDRAGHSPAIFRPDTRSQCDSKQDLCQGNGGPEGPCLAIALLPGDGAGGIDRLILGN